MENQSPSSSSLFLKTEKNKEKPDAIEVPSIVLPKGGGAIKGIDEKHTVNTANGTASLSVSLPFSPARGAGPALTLTYDSSAGNGIFGLGWTISLGGIKRKTDKGLPEYQDAAESDIFQFSEAEDLVPEFKKNPDGSLAADAEGNYIFNEKNSADGLFIIRYYRPRIDALLSRIERWTEKASGRIRWRILSRENVTTLFGWTDAAVIRDPDDSLKIFEWKPEFLYDDKGNCARYIYKQEDDTGLDRTLLHNRNRLKNGLITYTNLYLEKVFYGNKQPYKKFGDALPPESDFVFQTIFDYGTLQEHDTFDTVNNWDFRPDAFSDYKAGFEIRTTRLCNRILFFHVFDELALQPDRSDKKTLIKSLNLSYDISAEEDFTFLKSIVTKGYIKKPGGTYSCKELPPLEFAYQKHEWSSDIQSVSAENLVHAPAGLHEPQYQFVDLFNEGLSGILTEQAGGWYYKHNLGDGKFEQAKLISPKPAITGLGKQLQLADLDADGCKQLVNYTGEMAGYFELDDDNEWQALRSFKEMPNISFNDPNARMLDLNGDGRPDIVISEDRIFTWYPSAGRDGFAMARQALKPFDEEEGPCLVFADKTQTIYLADMSGDGMTDILRIRNGEICYWPNLGYGKFGKKIAMDNAPVFDHPDSFNPLYLRLADICGSGTTDIIYLGKNKFTCWKNLSGNRFGIEPFEIDSFPAVDSQSKITVTDLLGCGVACIVWSSPLPKNSNAPLQYIDLMKSRKPHIMVSYKNNLGKEVHLEYTPSTKFYLEDKLAGKPWITKLHIPVHCVSKTELSDKITGRRFVSVYKYHHGYYDHAEREFRGFGMAEQTDTESFEHWVRSGATNITDKALHQEPVITKTWIHTGAFISREKIFTQYANEYWYKEMERNGFAVVHAEQDLPDARLTLAPGLPAQLMNELSAAEWQQALRACKGIALRTETFAHDAPAAGATPAELKKQLTPYTVGTHNCVIELLQPKGKNRYAVFAVKESESVTYNYDRNPEDPRIAHTLNIKLDEYGNILESASVVYPRVVNDASLPASIQAAQGKTVILYTENSFTNDVTGDDINRRRLPAEVKTFELKGVAKTGLYYNVSDFEDILATAGEVAYYEDDKEPAGANSQKRLIQHIRTIYLSNNLKDALPLGQLESLALPYETFSLAYTPGLVTDIFGGKAADAVFDEGKFTHSEGDANWWVRSGTTQYLYNGETPSTAASRFYVPVSYTDPYNAKTTVKYGSSYYLFLSETEDALGNKARVDQFNYRTMSPKRISDINNNLSEVLVDELGMVKAMAVYGKGNEADELTGLTDYTDPAEQNSIDAFFSTGTSTSLVQQGKNLLQRATARFVYDFNVFRNTGRPAVIASILREEYYKENPASPVQLSFEYSAGIGGVVMKKVQATPGIANQATLNADGTVSVAAIDTSAQNPVQLRWIGNGRTIVNNKGKTVKQYEPYFSVTHRYENFKELVETGVTPLFYYDATGRLVKTEMPDSTFSTVIFESWKQTSYDANDNAPASDWYINRVNRLIDAELIAAGKDPEKEKAAAIKAALHADTPTVIHFDSLGRSVLSVEHNRNIQTAADEFYTTLLHLDTEGNHRSVEDARGNKVMQYRYDMLGNRVYQQSMDAGRRWLLTDVLSKPLRTWDDRNHEFRYFYDKIHRQTQAVVTGGDGPVPLNHIFDRTIYGESLLSGTRTDANRFNEAALQSRNILGKAIQAYDTGGLTATPDFDFKGQPLATTRKLFSKYKEVANWTDGHLATDLEPGPGYTFITKTDAVGRVKEQTAPDGSIITPSYNETGLLCTEKILHPGAALPSFYIKDIRYNEKGKQQRIIYGNDTSTTFYYDKETFKLNRLESKRQNNDPLQDWYYTFDAVGNITHIEDKNIPLVFFDNQKVAGVSSYTYDALYRLVEATGRENNAALNFDSKDNWNDEAFMRWHNAGDSMAVRGYTQSYQYDAAGNIIQIRHVSGTNSWTRNCGYESLTNRLASSQVGSQAYTYTHHAAHGFMTAMPHLEDLGWNFKEELVKTVRQRRTDGGTPETTYYQYDGKGQRIRKITENDTPPGAIPAVKEERIYVEGYELYIKRSGANAGLNRVSLSLTDGGNRFVTVETRNNIDDGSEQFLVRYQLHNHSGSCCLELDANASIISYEEYHPFGTTAYLAKNAAIRSTARRYRFTGMERDEETGLEYHSARYYLPWLGRWLSTDPIGIEDGTNVYEYVHNDPVNYTDLDGKQSTRVTETQLQNMTYTQVQSLILAGGGPIGACLANPTEADRQRDISTLRTILIRANLYDTTSIYIPPPPTAEEIERYNNQEICVADSHGMGYCGPRYIVEGQRSSANFGYQLQVLDNIRGGIGGTIGYAIDGERGSYIGAAADGLLMAAGATAQARADFRAIGASAQPSRPVAAEVRPATPGARPAARPAAPPAAPAAARPAAPPAAPAAARPAAPAAAPAAAPVAPRPAAPAAPAAPPVTGGGGGTPPPAPATTWRGHEAAVDTSLRASLPAGTPVGRQVTLDVTGPGGARTTIIIDNMYRDAAGNWQLVDAKFSSVRDLTTANLTTTVTPNQRLAYSWISSGTATSVVPRGTFATSAGIAGAPITVNPSVQIHVNSPTGIVSRNY